MLKALTNFVYYTPTRISSCNGAKANFLKSLNKSKSFSRGFQSVGAGDINYILIFFQLTKHFLKCTLTV